MSTKDQLEDAILQVLEADIGIRLAWDCGGDEAIISVYVNGKELEYTNYFAEELSLYLLNKLSLPDAGEFSMRGGGKLIMKGDEVYIEYESRLKGYEGFDEEFNPIGWQEVDEIDESNSGCMKLFD